MGMNDKLELRFKEKGTTVGTKVITVGIALDTTSAEQDEVLLKVLDLLDSNTAFELLNVVRSMDAKCANYQLLVDSYKRAVSRLKSELVEITEIL